VSDDRVVVRSSHRVSSDDSESLGDGLPVGVRFLSSSGSSSGEVVDGKTSGGDEGVCSIGPLVVQISGPVSTVVDLLDGASGAG